MTTPNISSFSVLDQESRSTRLTVSTDIVDYMSSERTFAREDLANAELSLVRQDVTHGWQRIDLQSTFGSSQVHALGAAWTEDDRTTVAVAVADVNQPSMSRVYVAYDLSSQQTDWDHVTWIDCGTRSTVRLDAIRVLD